MKPAKLNLTIYQGSDYSISFRVFDPVLVVNGVPISTPTPKDISNHNIIMQVKYAIDDDLPIFEATNIVGNDLIKIRPQDTNKGMFDLFIPRSINLKMNFSDAVYSLSIIEILSDRSDEYFNGNVFLHNSVTKPWSYDLNNETRPYPLPYQKPQQ